MSIFKGEVWFYKAPPRTWKYTREDSIQKGDKPVVIVSSDVNNFANDFVLVAPCSVEPQLPSPAHIKIEVNGVVTTVQCERIICVAKENLSYSMGELSDVQKKELDVAIASVFSLDIAKEPEDISESEKFNKYCSMYSVDAIEQFKLRLTELRNDCNAAIAAYNEQLQIHEDLLRIFPKVALKVAQMNQKKSSERGTHIRRSKEEKLAFLDEWDSCRNTAEKQEVALKYAMSLGVARNAYNRWLHLREE